MNTHLHNKSVIITGAGGGFGSLVSQKAAALGANVTCADISLEAADVVASGIREQGGQAQAVLADVINEEHMHVLAGKAVEAYGSIDVMINNAGVMPLAFISDHKDALQPWHQCIDVNFKGVVNGTVAVHDQMMRQGRGHVVNLSSIYGNHPVVGSAVYGATKAAVNYFSESVRVEARGKIKVTLVKPTAVLTTGLAAGVVNPEACFGAVGQNMAEFGGLIQQFAEGQIQAEAVDTNDIECAIMNAEPIADAIIYAIDQPWGVSIGDITVRASGDHYVI
ncbi:MAG: SDR family NAD(P)-dependent oxidoreductase [Pseudomonadota bacterium]